MAKNHGAKQQKKLAKQKAKRQEKRTNLANRDSVDPTIRMRRAEKWPVTRALMSDKLWSLGIGPLILARREGEDRIVFAVYMIDAYCLGVKNAYWQTGSIADLNDLIERMESNDQSLVPIKPECLAKIVQGAVEYANAMGFHPHRDFKHASLLLQGIDPSACQEEFTYGKDGKPFYISGPHESVQEVRAIVERVRAAGGDYMYDAGSIMTLIDDAEFDDDDEYDGNDIILDDVVLEDHDPLRTAPLEGLPSPKPDEA